MTGWADTLGRPALEVAPELLGSRLRHRTEEGTVAVRRHGHGDQGSEPLADFTARLAAAVAERRSGA